MRFSLAAKQTDVSVKGARKTDGPEREFMFRFDIWSGARCNASAAKAEPMLRIGEFHSELECIIVPRVGDLTGVRFGKLVVVSFVSKTKFGDKIWQCKCDCGQITNVYQGHLRSGHSTSCGCQKPQLNDFTGKRFGSLVVLNRADDYITPGNGKHYVRYDCQCDCGKKVTVHALNLKNGSTKSCGCQSPHAFSDLSGQRFGLLFVKHRVSDYVNPNGRKLVRYLCECECGKEVLELANVLRNGDAQSCGCVLRSRGEEVVRDFLDSYYIQYVLHQTFDGCLSDEGNKLSYDFYLPKLNALIECNGIQHYEPVAFFGGEDSFYKQQRHDMIKAQFARCNGFSYLVLDCRDIAQRDIIIKDTLIQFLNGLS